MCCWYSEKVGGALEASMQTTSIGLFAIGLFGNFYHHHLLATLRKPGETGYKLPRGGAFELVAAPHYLFELIGWGAVAYAIDHIVIVGVFLAQCAYLAERAKAQTEYNRKKIDGSRTCGWISDG